MSQDRVTLKVYRYNPEVDSQPYYREYEVPTEGIQTLLDALFYIQENLDPTLSFRFFCRAAVCGSCAVKVNGISRLACKTPFKTLVENSQGRPIVVEPLNFLNTVRDLVVDHEKPFENLKKLQTWCEPKQPVPEKEYRVPPEGVKNTRGRPIVSCALPATVTARRLWTTPNMRDPTPFPESTGMP